MKRFGALAAALALSLPTGPTLAQDPPPMPPLDRTHAQWIRPPHSNEMVWPGFAFYAHMSGHVVLDCLINGSGKLKPCDILEDKPVGQGFAKAALAFLEPSQLRAPTLNGAPIPDAHIQITVDFQGDQHSVRFMWRSQ